MAYSGIIELLFTFCTLPANQFELTFSFLLKTVKPGVKCILQST